MIKNLDTFDQDWSLEEYCRLIQLSLMYVMAWPEYHDNAERVAARVEHEMHFIRETYANGETLNDAVAEVGFCCG